MSLTRPPTNEKELVERLLAAGAGSKVVDLALTLARPAIGLIPTTMPGQERGL